MRLAGESEAGVFSLSGDCGIFGIALLVAGYSFRALEEPRTRDFERCTSDGLGGAVVVPTSYAFQIPTTAVHYRYFWKPMQRSLPNMQYCNPVSHRIEGWKSGPFSF